MPDGPPGWLTDDATAGCASAERQLWCAVIGRALEDALGNVGGVSGDSARWRAMDEARAWFLRNDDDFRRVCDAAGYDPDILRARVLRLIASRPVSPVAAAAAAIASQQEHDNA